MVYFKQETDYTCGVACLRMLFSAFTQEVPSEQDLMIELATNDKIGTHPDKIKEVATKYGYEVKTGENGTMALLDELRYDGYVIMLAISVDVPHWVVYLKNNNNHVFFNDPYFGEMLSRKIREFISPNQNYPHYRWKVKSSEFKKYLPEYNFDEVESNKLWIAIKK